MFLFVFAFGGPNNIEVIYHLGRGGNLEGQARAVHDTRAPPESGPVDGRVRSSSLFDTCIFCISSLIAD